MTQSYRYWQSPDLEILESSLERALMPAPPRAEFVDRLRHRLESKSRSGARIGWDNPGQIILIALAGAISGAIILVMGIQVVKALLNQKEDGQVRQATAPESGITIPAA